MADGQIDKARQIQQEGVLLGTEDTEPEFQTQLFADKILHNIRTGQSDAFVDSGSHSLRVPLHFDFLHVYSDHL